MSAESEYSTETDADEAVVPVAVLMVSASLSELRRSDFGSCASHR